VFWLHRLNKVLNSGHLKHPNSSKLTMSIHWPCKCTVHVYIVILFCDSMWSFWVEANLCSFLVVCLYCRWRSSYQERWVEITLTSLIPPHFCACLKPGPGFPTSYVVVFFVFSEFSYDKRWLFVLLILVELLTITN
jgi:hypothetical protein